MLITYPSNFFSRKTENIYQIIHKIFYQNFWKHQHFPLINLEVTSRGVFSLMTIDFLLLHSFLPKSIMVFTFLFLNASFNFVSTSLVSFLFFDFFSFFQSFESIKIFPMFICYQVYFHRSKWVVMFHFCNLLLKVMFNLLF